MSGIEREEDVRRTTVEVSKAMRRCQNRGVIVNTRQCSDKTCLQDAAKPGHNACVEKERERMRPHNHTSASESASRCGHPDSARSRGFRLYCRQSVSNPDLYLLVAPGRPKTEFCRDAGQPAAIRPVVLKRLSLLASRSFLFKPRGRLEPSGRICIILFRRNDCALAIEDAPAVRRALPDRRSTGDSFVLPQGVGKKVSVRAEPSNRMIVSLPAN